MAGLILLALLATIGLWIAAAVRVPHDRTRQDRTLSSHLLALAAGAGTALVLFALLQVTAQSGRPFSATPWHLILSTVLGVGLWAGLVSYRQGRQWLLRGAILLQLYCVGVLALMPFGFDHPSEWGLDFGHAMLLMIFYGLAAIAGLMLANVRRPGILALQVALFLIALFVVFGR